MCKCGLCTLDRVRTHFCTVCGRAHWSEPAADDCCDSDVTTDDFDGINRG